MIGTMSEPDVVTIAQNTFTIAAVLLAATIVLLNYSWKKLKAMIGTMPLDKQRVRFNLRSVSDRNEHYKHEHIGAQFAGCVVLGLSLLGSLMAVVGMSGVMVGDISGTYFQDNFEFSVAAMRAAVLCLLIGVFCLAVTYAEELISLYRGQRSVAMTKLEELPKRPPLEKPRLGLFVFNMTGYIVIIGLVIALVPHNQWVQMTVALVAGIGLIAATQMWHRARLRARTRESQGS